MSGVKESTSGGETPPEMDRLARKGLLKVITEVASEYANIYITQLGISPD